MHPSLGTRITRAQDGLALYRARQVRVLLASHSYVRAVALLERVISSSEDRFYRSTKK
jgi:hypothetical protein